MLAGVVTISASSPVAWSAERTRAWRAARTSDPGNPSVTFVGEDSQPGLEFGDHQIALLGRRLGLGGGFHLDLRCARAPTLFDIGHLANRAEVIGCRLEDIFELAGRFVVPTHFKQRTAKRDASGEIRWVLCEAGLADAHGLLELAGAPMLFGKLRKCNRRRILLDPASKFFNPWVVRHQRYGIEMVVAVDLLVRP